jgi:phage anti-repressor protein
MIIIANELIPVYENDGQQAVNTRELHEFLEVGKAYSDWFKYRADQVGLIEGEDFITILGKSSGGRPATDYIVPIDIAKEIAMMENNEKGREVRRYFITVEKKYRQQHKPLSQVEILAQSAQLLLEQDKRLTVVERKQTAMIDAITDLAQLDWAADMNRRINALCKNHGLNYQTFRSEMYRTLEATARCNLAARKRNLQDRMRQAGHKYAEVHAVTKLQVIADDPKLRAIFEGIVRTQQMKHAGGEAI